MRRPVPAGWRVLHGEGLGLLAEAPRAKALRLEDLSPQQLAAHETLLRCACSLAAFATQTPPSGPAVEASEPGSPVA